ncbi:MAG TPA: hypothetical protein PLX35_08265 [Cyclobacteriaceae bacterium]|nr:hypothetical protein [Cyclobacteriaceae bacterium]
MKTQHSNPNRSERLIDKALQREPDFMVSSGFADQVLMRLEAKHAQANNLEWWWLGLGLAGFVIAAVVGIVLSGFKPSLGVLTFLSTHGPLVIFGLAFVIALQWVDRRFIRRGASPV